MRLFLISLILALLPTMDLLAEAKPVGFCTYSPSANFSPVKSGPADPLVTAIRSMSEWKKAWMDMHPYPLRPPLTSAGQGRVIDPQQEWESSIPSIDFSKFTLIIAAIGRQRVSGHMVTIEAITEDQSSVFVNVIKISPGKGCGVIDVPTSPVALSLIPKTERVIVFDIAEVKMDCVDHEIKRNVPSNVDLQH